MHQHLDTGTLRQQAPLLQAGDIVLLSGTVYTARDAAHKRLHSLMKQEEALPFPLRDSVIYFAGPTPTPPNGIIGSCGPTTSRRMDAYTPELMDKGLLCTIGKGGRSPAVVDAIRRNQGLYLCALGGAGAICARAVKHLEVIAFEDLGCESVKRLEIQDMELVVGIDTRGKSIFSQNGKGTLV